jgi:6-pyruvoyltetrahydropterin/6-carboxytetrahydropterin synthase
MSELSITLCFQFSAGHLYKNDNWTAEENKEKFGKCFSKFGHGHDYTLEVEFSVELFFDIKDSIPALIKTLKHQIQTKIIDSIDHQHFNFDITEFKNTNLIPTTENISIYLKKRIQTEIIEVHYTSHQLKVIVLRLFEGSSIFTEV